ncbi:MAG: amidase [Firmicutes bacterium HGW-Firmicutes-1]|jgi:amidase|nr:MAG: amidase [Firmicutes bacterium HGW-Firmicutes-1]
MKDFNILELQEQMQIGTLSATKLTQYYIDRIHQYDHLYNSVFEINSDALSIALELDEERRERGRRSLLHGIPILLKDNINADFDGKLRTTAGALILENLYANYDATIVKKLKEAGAIIIGKTNLTEFANIITDHMPAGFSTLGGQVKNPYGNFDVGGSSSGSGVAIAMDFCTVAIGTETSGSIIDPASCNGIIGVKPTVGVASRYGIIPISWTQDVPGPMSRNIIDAAIVLDIMKGEDHWDASTQLKHSLPNYLHSLEGASLIGVKLGLPQGEFIKNVKTEKLEMFYKAVAKFEELGATVIEVKINNSPHNINKDVLFYEFPIALKKYFESLGEIAPVKTLEEIVQFNNENTQVRAPYGQTIFERCLALQKDYEEKYQQALSDSIKYGKELEAVIDQSNLDALLFVGSEGVGIAAKAGYPSVTLPGGYAKENEPVGITLTGKSFTEDKLLGYANTFEKHQQYRYPRSSS